MADQLAKLADLYIAKQQGIRMAGLTDFGEDLLKLAETGIRDGSSSYAGLVKEIVQQNRLNTALLSLTRCR